MSDNVNHPKHYTQVEGHECIDFSRHMTFVLGNAFKYLWRARNKNGIEDLKKARWYLNDCISNPNYSTCFQSKVMDAWIELVSRFKIDPSKELPATIHGVIQEIEFPWNVMHVIAVEPTVQNIAECIHQLDLVITLLGDVETNQLGTLASNVFDELGPLNRIGLNAHNCAVRHGWYESERSALEIHALIHSEIAEATECVRNGESPVWVKNVPTQEHTLFGKPEGEAVELADALIRILDHASARGWDMDKIVADKMAYNETRPYRHGGKTK
jgi:hypothetical protein